PSLALGLRAEGEGEARQALAKEAAEIALGLAGAEAAAKSEDPAKLPPAFRAIADGRNPWGKYAEGQLIDWAASFLKARPASRPALISGDRAGLLARALRLRSEAERAAA